jgi:hypothetical protein
MKMKYTHPTPHYNLRALFALQNEIQRRAHRELEFSKATAAAESATTVAMTATRERDVAAAAAALTEKFLRRQLVRQTHAAMHAVDGASGGADGATGGGGDLTFFSRRRDTGGHLNDKSNANNGGNDDGSVTQRSANVAVPTVAAVASAPLRLSTSAALAAELKRTTSLSAPSSLSALSSSISLSLSTTTMTTFEAAQKRVVQMHAQLGRTKAALKQTKLLLSAAEDRAMESAARASALDAASTDADSLWRRRVASLQASLQRAHDERAVRLASIVMMSRSVALFAFFSTCVLI